MRPAILVFGILMTAITAFVATCGLDYYEKKAAGVAWLEPRSFEALTAIAIGTGGAYENPDRLGPAIAVGLGERVVLVDAGRGVCEGLRAARIPVQQPDAVYLTSLLPENTVGLDDLLLTGWLAPRAAPLRLVGPPGTRDLARALERAHAAARAARAGALGLPPEGGRFAVREVEKAFTEGTGALAVRGAPLPGGPLPAFAWRFEAGGRSVVVGGPGWSPDALIELAEGADLLFHEAYHHASVEMAVEAGVPDTERIRREAALHTDTADVGGLAQRAGVRTLALVRLRPPPLFDFQFTRLVGEGFEGRVVIAEDGEELTPGR